MQNLYFCVCMILMFCFASVLLCFVTANEIIKYIKDCFVPVIEDYK